MKEPPSTRLAIGQWSAVFEEGFIRYIRCGGVELVRMINFSVRDADWRTVPYQVDDIEVDQSEEGWVAKYTCLSVHHSIDYRWECEIRANADGLEFNIKGTANSHFLSNRIGFCVLHPIAECAGRSVEVVNPDGSVTEGAFPELISPHQPFTEIAGLSYDITGSRVSLSFSGEVFEMEDQRNWSDASFKTYCTPLNLPFPVAVVPGDRIEQQIRLSISDVEDTAQAGELQERCLDLSTTKYPLPPLGVEANASPLSDWAIHQLKMLHLSHLRVELRLEAGWIDPTFNAKIDQAKAIHAPVALCLIIDIDADWYGLLGVIKWDAINIKHITVIDAKDKCVGRPFLELVLPRLRSVFGSNMQIGGGTDHYFAQLNRQRPAADLLDFISFSSNPQVHAFDDQSILETGPVLADMVDTAKSFGEGKPIHISPITLRPRSNPDATQEVNGAMEPDPRQSSQLNALWTLSVIKHLTQYSAADITFFQTEGDFGLLSANDHTTYPVFDMLIELLGDPLPQIIGSTSSHPLDFEGLLLEYQEGRVCGLLANYISETIEINICAQLFVLEPQEIKLVPLDMAT